MHKIKYYEAMKIMKCCRAVHVVCFHFIVDNRINLQYVHRGKLSEGT